MQIPRKFPKFVSNPMGIVPRRQMTPAVSLGDVTALYDVTVLTSLSPQQPWDVLNGTLAPLGHCIDTGATRLT